MTSKTSVVVVSLSFSLSLLSSLLSLSLFIVVVVAAVGAEPADVIVSLRLHPAEVEP